MLRRLSLAHVALGLALAVVVAVAVLWYLPSGGYFIYLPDRAHPLAAIVRVPGTKPHRDTGGIYFVAVSIRKARLFERLFPQVHEGASLERVNNVLGGVSEEVDRREQAHAMTISQQVAAAVVFQTLGYRTRARLTGVLVLGTGRDAPISHVLRPGDVIVGVDGKRVGTLPELRRVLARHRPGDEVRVRFRRKRTIRSATVRTIEEQGRTILGVNADQAVAIKLPRRVQVDIGAVGGSSAGLAFALELMQKLGHDVERGHKIAATGALGLDGSIGEIGGVKQKTIGAREAHVDVFLVPAGPNAREARRYANGLRIIPVKTFPQALRVLATIPRAS